MGGVLIDEHEAAGVFHQDVEPAENAQNFEAVVG